MYLRVHFFRIALLPCLALLFAACGDVGNAPRAQTGDAVSVSEAEGIVLPIDTTQSQLKWRAAKVTRAHDGGFRSFSGSVTVNDQQVTGVHVHIDTRSIWSDTERLTGHLMSPDFFDVANFPDAHLEASQFTPIDSVGATHRVTGNLTMHGVTNGVTFPASIAVGENGVQASADFIIDRTDWDITYAGQADDLIEHNVRIIFDIVASAEAPIALVSDRQ